MNQSYKRMKFKEKRKNEGKEKILDDKKNDKIDDNISLGNITNVGGSSTNVDSTSNFTGLRRATSNLYGFKKL